MPFNPTEVLIALDRLPVGGKARIAEIRGDRSLARRLLGLGLRDGSEIEIMQRRNKGIVVACSGNRVALGDSIADKLFIHPLGENQSVESVQTP